MKGEGQAIAHGAVTILNAFATGKGGALGIDLWTRAHVALHEGSGEIIGTELDSQDQNKLSVTVARRIIEHFGYRERVSGKVTTKSNIPLAVGLKSSSAAANAVALATASALGENVDDETLLRIGIDASMECGTSLTGAFDDSYASYHGGAVITDNELRKVQKIIKPPRNVEILILVPERKRFTGSLDRSSFSSIRGISEIAYEQALQGKIWDALTLNGLAVSAVLGEDPSPALSAIQA
ncbi:MAG TPA: shikimate kinase, partial [Candidatus Bathyarchaeia archaeon]|nr:shikimate kinase [Candidatus Bathyarchaeia archaeon]